MLSVLYPGLYLGEKFHGDYYIFTKSLLTRKTLMAAGSFSDKVDDFLAAFILPL